MKILRVKKNEKIFLGILDKDEKIKIIDDIDDISSENIEDVVTNKINKININKLETLEGDYKILPCVNKIGKIICVGLNYADHAAESGLTPPTEPMLFSKAITSINGPYDEISLPISSKKTDWEIELGIIILKKAKNISEEVSEDYIAGYTIVNDVSERHFQIEREGQFVKGKSHDTFCPIGPYLVTKDEIPNVNNLSMKLKVNNEIMQDGNTSNLIFKPNYIVSYISQFMTLMPGDIIPTGTPAGVGMGMKPQKFLKKGDIVDLKIDYLGFQKQKVI
tara:strand:+ start:1092 stop:1925 length:834 start_codon:yes stop_codon:yes gene_type:complete